jgi:class 3 adenylate cyclase
LESEELTSLLNEYLTEMSRIAHEYGAYFDKFIGDAMMFYFGDPESKGVKEDASACVRMAIEMQRRLRQLQTRWREQGLIDRPFEARIGINTGYCTVGNFGSEDRMDYTIIGGEVNLAARLEAHADYGGILMAAETYSLVKDWLVAEEREAITMKGFSKPIRTFSVRGIYDELSEDESVFRHEDEGVTITINGDRADKAKTKAALEAALAHLKA